MKCPQCQHPNTPRAKFCEECATPLPRSCSACGAGVSATAKFCPECGQPLAAAAPAAKESPLSSPTSYTPKHLADKILSSREAIEGERKLVTILFADLKGSMELLDQRDPEEARSILDPVLKLMMDAVHYYEGTVSLAMGDGIMAIFGAPVAHEDHGVRACYAALRMQDMANKHAEVVERTHGLPLLIRVGLNSGDVVVRSVGSDLHMDYTAIGETTHLASRLEQMAAPGSILLGPVTKSLAEGYVVMKPLGPRQVKGRAAPIDVYEAVGATAVRSRLQAAAARGLARFVGRTHETELLTQRLERARAGEGQVVAVVGEAGLGKSRLLWEIRQSQQTQNWLVLESSSASYGKASSFLPLIELLKSYFKIDSSAAPQDVREKVASRLAALDHGLTAHLPALLFLLEIPHEDASWAKLDPAQRRQRALDAIRALLLCESRVQPLMILFEDLQWIDGETQAFLDGFIDNLPKARILLLINYRPEYQHGWTRKTFYREIRLDPLPPTSVDVLLNSILGVDPALAPLKQLLIDRTEGNPLFLEESIRALVEMKFLDGDFGSYRLLKTAETLHIPASAQAILTARIDRLLPEDKRVLQAAAVLGKEVPYVLLKELGGEDEERLRTSLDNLQAAEFLYQTALFPELEFTFHHALTQSVAYRSLVNERRRSLHAAIVNAMEAIYPDRLLERADRLAHHAFHGEVWDKAVDYARQAGLKALARSANREALTFFEQALAALKKLAVTPKHKELAIDLRFDMRLALMPLGEFARTLDLLREAEALAAELDDRQRLGWVAGYLTNLLWEMGEQDRAVESGLRAMDFGTKLGHGGIRDLSHRYLGRSYHAMGDYRRAVDVFLHAIEPAEQGPNAAGAAASSPSAVLTRSFLVLSLSELGAFSQAFAHGEEAVRLAKSIDNPLNLSAAQCALGRVYLRKGEFQRAADLLEQALAVCRSANIPLLFPFTASPLGAAYARMGRVSEAVPLLEQAAERAAAMRRMVDQPLWTYWWSQGMLLANDIDRAAELAQRAMQLSITYKERGSQGWVHRLLGDIGARTPQDKGAEAEQHYQNGLAIAQELGMRPLQSRCQLGLADLYLQLGRMAEAQKAATAAHELCGEMEMGKWREQAAATLARLTGSAYVG